MLVLEAQYPLLGLKGKLKGCHFVFCLICFFFGGGAPSKFDIATVKMYLRNGTYSPKSQVSWGHSMPHVPTWPNVVVDGWVTLWGLTDPFVKTCLAALTCLSAPELDLFGKEGPNGTNQGPTCAWDLSQFLLLAKTEQANQVLSLTTRLVNRLKMCQHVLSHNKSPSWRGLLLSFV